MTHRCFYSVENFAGKQELTRAYLAEGMPALALDRKYDEALDFAAPGGFKRAVCALRWLRAGGNAWLANECTTWIWVGRKQTGRCKERVDGNKTNPHVAEANKCKDLGVLVMLLCHLSGRFFVVEQPVSSLLTHDRAFANMVAWSNAAMIVLDHGYFDADGSQKPLKLIGNLPNLPALARKLSRTEARKRPKLSTRTADGKVTGITHALAESEHYSAAFGKAVALLHENVFNP